MFVKIDEIYEEMDLLTTKCTTFKISLMFANIYVL